MNKNNLSWSVWLGADKLKETIIRALWLFPHDMRRSFFKTILPTQYWSLMAYRGGKQPPYNYQFCKKYKCIFVHIPKAAGTSVYKQILNGHTGHFSITDYQIMFGEELFDQYFKFTIVRNPWDRLVSAFFYLKHSGSSEDKKWAQKMLAQYDDFNSFITDLPNSKFHTYWIHFIPQYKFLIDPMGNMPLDHIGKLENIDSEIKLICQKLNIEAVNLGIDNPSPHREHYSKYYTEKTKTIVENIYKKDINLFEYSFSD